MTNIPAGWAKLSENAEIKKGDMFLDAGDWILCTSSIGGLVREEFSTEIAVIRKVQDAPKKEKVWLNPWD